MISEKQLQIRDRRLSMGFNNPKKDAWAKRRRSINYIPTPVKETDMLEDILKDSDDLKITKVGPGLFQRIWSWIKKLCHIN